MMTERTAGAAHIRVIIVDDHALFRQGVGRLLETAGMRVIAGARDGREGLCRGQKSVDAVQDGNLTFLRAKRMSAPLGYFCNESTPEPTPSR